MREGLAGVFDPKTMEALLDYAHPSGLRRANTVALLDDTDLAALVEVERPVINDVLNHARRAGQPLEVEVGWRNDPHVEWGSAVLWRTGAFELVASTVGSMAVGAHTTQTYTAVLLRRTGGDEALVCVVAVHLKAGGMHLESVRAEQARLAVEGAEELVRAALGDARVGSTPIVVAGDFNSHRLHPRARVDRQMTRLGFEDAGAATPCRTIKHGGDAIFDYIYTRNLPTIDYAVRDDTSEDISPNLTEGSDHLPVYCTLKLNGTEV